jgi:hypothetical protein
MNDWKLFGYTEGECNEYDSFWLGELEEISSSSFDYRIKQDPDWQSKRLSEIIVNNPSVSELLEGNFLLACGAFFLFELTDLVESL